jgi:hypothetical protein
MGYELNQLMKSYGLTTRTMSPYSGVAAPTALAADATDEQRKKFNDDTSAYIAQRGAYDSYKNEYQNRIANTSPYQNSPLFKGQKQNWDTNLVAPTYSSSYTPVGSGTANPSYADNLANEWVRYGDPQTDPGKNAWLNTRTKNLTYGEKPYVAMPAKTATTDTTATGGTTTDTTKKADGTAAGHYENQITGYANSSSTDSEGNVIQGDPIYGQVWVPGLAHGGPVRHFYGGGQNKIDGGIGDLVDRYDLANPTELPVTYAAADTGTRSDATVDAPVASTPVPAGMLRGMQESAVRAGEPPMQRGPVPPAESNPEMTTPAGGATLGAAPAAAPAATGSPSLQTLYEKYISKQPKSTEMTAAEQKYAAKNDALISLLKEQASKTEENAPSKAEMYFRLAAALANPTKSRGFAGVMENVGAAAKELAEFQKSTTDAKRAAAAAKLQLLLKTGEIDAQQAKDELDKLRAEDKEVRGVAQTFAMKEFETASKLAEPQSEYAKRLKEAGVAVGTPEFKQAMADANKLETEQKGIALQAARSAEDQKKIERNMLTPKEAEKAMDLEKEIRLQEAALKDLEKAEQLSPKAYLPNVTDSAKRAFYSQLDPEDPDVKATETLERLLNGQTLANAKKLTGSISNKDLSFLQALSGSSFKNRDARTETITDAIQKMKDEIAASKNDLKRVQSREFRNKLNVE